MNRAMVPMPEAELRRKVALLGPPPVLSTEDTETFEVFFFEFAKCFKVRDMLMLMLVWEYTANSWFIRRYARHSALAVDGWFETTRKNSQLAAKSERRRLEIELERKIQYHRTFGNVAAEVSALQEQITMKVEEIAKLEVPQQATERDHNDALQRRVDFVSWLDERISNATRRRKEGYDLIEQYSAGLGRTIQETADAILDAEFRQIDEATGDHRVEGASNESKVEGEREPEATIAPSITPVAGEKANDVEPQIRSESAE